MSGRTLRLALSMRGGVSLAVWMGGAVAEIDALRWDLARGADAETTLGRVARALGTEAVEIDVISGTSAGGLNGVVLGTAMVNQTRIDRLRDVWLEMADLATLLRDPGGRPKPSILDSEGFLARAQSALRDIAREAPAGPAPPPIKRVDAFFPVTSVVPTTRTAWTDPFAPVTERRVGGWIWLQHRDQPDVPPGLARPGAEPLPPLASDFLVPVDADAPSPVGDLALAVCSTAAFPVAFAPTTIARPGPDEGRPGALAGRIRFPGREPTPLHLFDGGVVDNMPVGRAMDAISRAPADGPTERVLVYLHPSPTEKDPAKAARKMAAVGRRGPFPIDVAGAAMTSLAGKSLVADLVALEAHNRAIGATLRERMALLARPPGTTPPRREAIAASHAARLVSLLADPAAHLEPLGPRSESATVRPVLLDLSPQHRAAWIDALTDALLARPATWTPRPWSEVIRTASLLVEWAGWMEPRLADPRTASDAKSTAHTVRTRAYLDASTLDLETVLLLHEEVEAGLRGLPVAAEVDRVLGVREEVLTRAGAALTTELAGRLLGAAALVLRGAHQQVAIGAPDPVCDCLPEALAHRLQGVDPTDHRAAVAVLSQLDSDLLPLHGQAPTDSYDQVRYHTLSGTAVTPLARGFRWPEPLADIEALSVLALDWLPAIGGVRSEPGVGRIDPGSKLAGNQLRNFAAFLDRTWRANDWMWGRADATETLVRLLLDPSVVVDHPAAAAAAIEAACRSDEWPEDGAGWAKELTIAANGPWTAEGGPRPDELRRAVRDELAGTGDRALTRALVLHRRHLEVVAAELGRADDRPHPGPRAATFADAAERWNEAPRRLGSRWGVRDDAELGVRATFLAARTAFAHAPRLLKAVRSLLLPVVGPLVAVALSRWRGVVATALVLGAVVLPRTYDHPVGPLAVALVSVAVVAGGLRATWLPGDDRRGPGAPWSIAAIVLAAATAAVAVWMTFATDAAETLERDGWVSTPGSTPLLSLLVPALGAALGASCVWWWTRPGARVLLAVVAGGAVAAWVRLGAYGSEVRDWSAIGWISRFGSMWWCAPAVAVATTALVATLRVGRLHGRGPKDASA